MRIEEAKEIIKIMRSGKRVNSQYFASVYTSLTGKAFPGIGDSEVIREVIKEMEAVIEKKSISQVQPQDQEKKIVDVTKVHPVFPGEIVPVNKSQEETSIPIVYPKPLSKEMLDIIENDKSDWAPEGSVTLSEAEEQVKQYQKKNGKKNSKN